MTPSEFEVKQFADQLLAANGHDRLDLYAGTVLKIMALLPSPEIEYATAAIASVDDGHEGRVLLFTNQLLIAADLTPRRVSGNKEAIVNARVWPRRDLQQVALVGEQGGDEERWADQDGWHNGAQVTATYRGGYEIRLPLGGGRHLDEWTAFLPKLLADLTR